MSASPFRDAAIAFAERAAESQFRGRKGHGGAGRVVQRHLSRQQLAVLLAAAFELGAKHGAAAARAAPQRKG